MKLSTHLRTSPSICPLVIIHLFSSKPIAFGRKGKAWKQRIYNLVLLVTCGAETHNMHAKTFTNIYDVSSFLILGQVNYSFLHSRLIRRRKIMR